MESKFTGGVTLSFYKLAVWLVSGLTLGLCYPVMACGYWRWKANHTYINGLKMQFTGKASALFKKFIVWLTLCILTVGIYGILKLNYDILKWQIENTHIEGREGQKSYFDAKWYHLLGARMLCALTMTVTLSIGGAWIHCAYQEWLCWRTYIDGNNLDFKGAGKELFFKNVLWGLLTGLTLYIYGFWHVLNIVRWDTAQIEFKGKEDVVAGKTVLIIRPEPALPKSVAAVNKPVPGDRFKRVYDFMKVKRAMMCFTLEIPFIIGVTLLMAFTLGSLTYLLAPALLWFLVLLSLPCIFIVEERFKEIGEIKLESAMAWSITGLIFSLAIPVFLPIFIYGLVEIVRLKEWIYGNEEIGEAIISEQEEYFDASKKYQNYIWDCANYKKAVKNYAKGMIDYNEKLKAYKDATAVR